MTAEVVTRKRSWRQSIGHVLEPKVHDELSLRLGKNTQQRTVDVDEFDGEMNERPIPIVLIVIGIHEKRPS